MKDWVWRRGWSPRKRKLLANIFGHLTIRYTRSRFYSDYKGHKETQKYKVIGSDSETVSITWWYSFLKEQQVRKIHFEGDRYWISIGRHKEWFKRVTKSAS